MSRPTQNNNIQPPEKLPPPDDQLTPGQAAAILEVSITQMYDWIRQGYPVWTGGRTGGRWVLSRAQVLAAKVKREAQKVQLAAEKKARDKKEAQRRARLAADAQMRPGLPRAASVRELVGVSDCARILNTTRARVYMMAYAGELPVVPRRAGPGEKKTMAFKRADIEAIAQAQTKPKN